MYLKSLTLKGFKSFASTTTLRLEPGICAVVGPNGSGKSNVVDALSWVMGEQGAKALRGGNMQDVIFAGTSGRQPLGRAEVTLTIDNSDGALPIDYSEVSVTRRMFRDGAGEYEINGARCRLMDVQELLSDSGIGREMHVIVGQGRLAEILEARPEERRAYIEEAAGVLKHRRRKEKAQRKLQSMQGNLDRLTDLTGELRRQLKPLARQAEVARRAQTIQADVRDSTLRIAADDVVARRTALESTAAAEEEARRRAEEISRRLEEVRTERDVAEAQVAELTPATEAAQREWFALSALAERVSATRRIADDRARALAQSRGAVGGQSPEALEEQAEEAQALEEELADALEEAGERLEAAQDNLADREHELAAVEKEHAAAIRAVADRREGLARLSGSTDTARARLEATEAELARLAEGTVDAEARRTAAREAVTEAEDGLAEIDSRTADLVDAAETAADDLASVTERRDTLRADERRASTEATALAARIEALEVAASVPDAGSWLAEHSEVEVRGALSDALGVSGGWERAIAAALGPAGEALIVGTDAEAHTALSALREGEGGRAVMLIEAEETTWRLGDTPPAGAQWALDVVTPESSVAAAVTALLVDVALVNSLAAATEVVTADPRLRAVTPAGDVVGAGWMSGGAAGARTGLELRRDIEASREKVRAAEQATERLAAALAGAEEEFEDRRQRHDRARAQVAENSRALAAAREEAERATAALRRLDSEEDAESARRASLEDRRDELAEQVAELEERLRRAEDDASGEDSEGPNTELDRRRSRAAEALAAARSVEVEARLARRTAEERLKSVSGKAAGLRRAAAAQREAHARAERAERRRRAAAEVAAAVAETARDLLERVEEETRQAVVDRDALIRRRDAAGAARNKIRSDLSTVEREAQRLTDAAHREELARAAAAERAAALEEQVLQNYGVPLEDLIADYGPDVPLPPTAQEMEEYEAAKARGEQVVAPVATPYDREEQLRRKKRAERELKTLGKVNPLALEEYAALEERYTFLSTQLEDVKKAREDLLGVIEDVDARILELFTEAWHDVEREFVDVFATLFPGGEGRLVLTDPGDMLTTGIEVEARPPGKKVKRLSLLSGGEKSLTAVAMLVAIFKARPSPFYVMDEVEAALDDTNLRRLLGLFEQLRSTSQLIVITHQKPTMDIADVLYGVSMRGDGVTRVISQRMSRDEAEEVVPVDSPAPIDSTDSVDA